MAVYKNASQRAYEAALTVTLKWGGARRNSDDLKYEVSQLSAAEKFHVSSTMVNYAIIIIRKGIKELNNEVIKGSISIVSAVKMAKMPRLYQYFTMVNQGMIILLPDQKPRIRAPALYAKIKPEKLLIIPPYKYMKGPCSNCGYFDRDKAGNCKHCRNEKRKKQREQAAL